MRARHDAVMVGAGTALTGALSGWGVWTLVAAPMMMMLTEAVGMTRAARAPIWPSFRFAGAGHIAGFGGVMTATQIFWFIQSQADVMIAGRVLDPHWLGVYSTGLFLAQLLAELEGELPGLLTDLFREGRGEDLVAAPAAMIGRELLEADQFGHQRADNGPR